MTLGEVIAIYRGSDGEATKRLYARLEGLGPVGVIAVNLFRAQKASERAKVYRGGIRGRGSFSAMAYDRKQWSMANLATAFGAHAKTCGLEWGWGQDAKQEFHRWVLYVELPTGQVSFHTDARGAGPDAPRPWDGSPGMSSSRICSWVAQLLASSPMQQELTA